MDFKNSASLFDNVKFTGIVSIEVLDAETGEVKRTQQSTNDLTRQGAFWLSVNGGIGGYKDYNAEWYTRSNWLNFDEWPDFYSAGTNNLAISPDRHMPHATGVKWLTNTTLCSTIIGGGTYSSGNPGMMTWKFRYNAPTANRTIWTVGLTGRGTGNPLMTLSPLSTACTQSATEILDITYRIQIHYGYNSISTGNALSKSDNYSKGLAYCNAGINSAKSVFAYYLMPHKVHNKTMNYRAWGNIPWYDSGYIAIVPESSWNFKGRMSMSWDINTGVGRLIQSLYTRSKNPYNNAWNFDDQGGGIFDKFGNSSFTNKPIQPVFLHSSTSTIPFMDINNVGTSSGTLSIDGTNWQETKFPEYYRLDFSKSGDVGTSKYYFRNRILTGFEGNTYKPTRWWDSFTSRMTTNWYGDENTTLVGMHGSSKVYQTQWEEYTDTKFVLFDDTGISIIDITNGDGVNFDATTTPALSVLKVQQVGVNFSNGDVWVACNLTGLYRIQNPFNNPVITKFTTIDAISNVNKAYAVSLGYNNSIWCAIDGAIAKTTDDGATWTLYNLTSPNVFSFTGITDNNWHRIKQIRTDINSATNDIGIVYATSDITFPPLALCWRSDTLTAAGPSAISNSNLNTVWQMTRYWPIRCSHYGSTWVVGVPNTTNGYYPPSQGIELKVIKFGTATVVTNFMTGDSYGYMGAGFLKNYNISFYYDYYNIPHTIVQHAEYHSGAIWKLQDIRGNAKGLIVPRSDWNNCSWWARTDSNELNNATGSFGFNASYNKSPMVHNCTNHENAGGGARTSSHPGWFRPIFPNENYNLYNNGSYPTTGGFNIDDLNGKFSPFEEILWSKYHWNPNTSQWQKNYYAPAIDSSASAINGVRHNFSTESHAFTGRSLIDITSNLSSAAINGTATFAFTVNSLAKLTGVNQELASTLLSLEDSSKVFRIVWAGGTNFEIHHGTTSTTISSITTAFPGVDHRIVVVINGTSCEVYSNGVQLGTTLTMATAFDFSAPDSSFKAYLGAQVYYRSFSTTIPMPYGFFRGTLKNVQVWNVAWDSTDITNDYIDILGLISSKDISNLKCRLLLTEELIETKPTHADHQVLNNGITLKFNANAIEPSSSANAGDYYTFGVVDGILKDNATTFSHRFDIYGYVNVDSNFSNFKNVNSTNIIENIAAPVITPLHWNPMAYPFHCTAGQCIVTQTDATGNYTFRHNMGLESIEGDGEISFYLANSYSNLLAVGLTTDTTWYETTNSSLVWPRLKYVLRFTPTGGEVREGSATAKTGSSFTHAFGDKFTIRRTGTVITYLKNDVAVYTSTNASTLPLTPIMFCDYDSAQNNSRGVINSTITYTPNRAMMFAGDIIDQSGCFDRKFLGLEYSPSTTFKLKIDGVDAPVTIADTFYGQLHKVTTPVPGQITVIPYAGILIFDTADIGKTISGTCVSISDV